jgi:hypothetical protein
MERNLIKFKFCLSEVDIKKSPVCRTDPARLQNIALCADGVTDGGQFKTNDLSYGSVIRQMMRWTFRPICFRLPDSLSVEQTRTNSTVHFTSSVQLQTNLCFRLRCLEVKPACPSTLLQSSSNTHCHQASTRTLTSRCPELFCTPSRGSLVMRNRVLALRRAASNTRDTQSGTERWWWC